MKSPGPSGLAREEASERARLVSNLRYDIDLDLTEGHETFGSDTRFAPTLPIAPYHLAFVAEPFHSYREIHQSDGREVDLGLFCRRSLAEHLDHQNILEITKGGLRYFEDRFRFPYPFGKYDQVFVPDFKWGGMENVACVTLKDKYVFTSRVPESSQQERAELILHELAHMWFGNLVTMRWWDDLWLNESFASLLSYLATGAVTSYPASWTTWANDGKVGAYRLDLMSVTHPVAAAVDDTEAAETIVDSVTYHKGAAALRQLILRIGEEAFFAGLQEYFRRFQFANATKDDFLQAMADAAGGKLGQWPAQWLDRIGPNTLRGSMEVDDGGHIARFEIAPRPAHQGRVRRQPQRPRVNQAVQGLRATVLDVLRQLSGT